MIKKGFKMKLHQGKELEYQKRHDLLWPEMKQLLNDAGVTSYSIFLESETGILFGYVELENEELWNQLAKSKINQKWWVFMADIMETNNDQSPKTIDLTHVFDLSY